MSKIERLSSVTDTIICNNDPEESPKISFGPAAGGVFIVDAVDNATSIAWHVAFGPELAGVPINDGTADITTAIVANKAYPIPDALFAAPFIVAVTDAGTATIRFCAKG